MRVVAAMATESISGPGRQLAALARYLAGEGVDLHVLVFRREGRADPPFAEYLERLGVSHELICDRGPLDWRMAWEVQRRLRLLKPAVVQTHGYKATAVGYALRRAGMALPWLGFFHGSTNKGAKDRLYQRIERLMLASADRVAVVANAQAETFARLGSRVTVVPNAVVTLVGTADEEAAVIDHRLQMQPRPRIGVVGRLSREKGVDVFLSACKHLRERGSAFSAVLVGDGPQREPLEKLVSDLGLAEQVHFLGRIDAVDSVYPHLDLVVLPSRSEGLPNVLLEAIAADVPVVATHVGAVPEVLREPGSGTVVPPGNPRALANGILSALELRGSVEAREARRRVVDRYSLERRVEQHLHIYRDLTGIAGCTAKGVIHG